jgi:hypothetical protein
MRVYGHVYKGGPACPEYMYGEKTPVKEKSFKSFKDKKRRRNLWSSWVADKREEYEAFAPAEGAVDRREDTHVSKLRAPLAAVAPVLPGAGYRAEIM